MVGRLRNGKKFSDDSDENREFNESYSDSNRSIEEDNLDYDDEETSIKSNISPHTELRNKLKDDLLEIQDDNENVDHRNSLQKRRKIKTRSRSTSRTRAASLERSYKVKDSPKLKRPKSTSLCCKFILIILTFSLSGYFGYQIYQKTTNTMTIDHVFSKYNDSLHGRARTIIKVAIENSQKKDKPTVLLLNSNSQTKIKEFYLDLSASIKKDTTSNLNSTIFNITNFINDHDKILNNLKIHRIALFDGLENLDARNYMELYGFVDENDAHVQKCLIIISLYDKKLNTSINFDDIFMVENEVRVKLRKLWHNSDKNNLEAFLNRIVSFVAFIF